MPGQYESEIKQPLVAANTHCSAGNQWYHPVVAGASTLAASVMNRETIQKVRELLGSLAGDSYSEFLRGFIGKGLAAHGDDWQYADICSVLLALADKLEAADYLEIGVRTGRSMAMVASRRPDCRIVGFDMWIENYAGMENPGPQLVTDQLKCLGHKGELVLVEGDSHETVPAFFERFPDRSFDLISVDGDHSEKGAIADILTVLPRLKVGGAIVFDDIAHPAHPNLGMVWERLVKKRAEFSTFEFTELGYGVAFGIRHY